MAEIRKIVVEINDKVLQTEKQTTIVNNETNNTEVNLTALIHPIKEAEKHLLGKSVLLNQAFNVAKSGVKQSIDLSLNRYFNMKENYIGQTDYNNFMRGINVVSSVGTSIIGGAMLGMKAGPIGAVAGATIGGVSAGINLFIGHQARLSNYYSSLNASNVSLQYGRERAGLIDGSKGTEN